MNKHIQLLIEGLFDDVFQEEKDNVVNDVTSDTTYFASDIRNILLPYLGTDKLKRWKYDSLNNKLEYFSNYTRQTHFALSSYIKNVRDKLQKQGFIKYENSEYPNAFISGYTDLRKYLNDLSIPFYNYMNTTIERYNSWIQKYNKMPAIVQEIFKKDVTCTEVLLSPDNGIILKIYLSKYLHDDRDRVYLATSEDYQKATIELTNLVNYAEHDKEEKNNILKIENKKSYLLNIFKRLSTTELFRDFKVYLDDNNDPYIPVYFNWDVDVQKSNKKLYKSKNIPNTIEKLILEYNFEFVNKLEKEDDNAIYELIGNFVTIKVYNNLSNDNTTQEFKNKNKIYYLNKYRKYNKIKVDAKLLIELTDIGKEHINKIEKLNGY